MKSSRRQFLEDLYETMEGTAAQYKDRKQVFNMCGYAAPAIPNLRVGYIGLGNRGYASIQRLGRMNAVEIRAICDPEERMEEPTVGDEHSGRLHLALGEVFVKRP